MHLQITVDAINVGVFGKKPGILEILFVTNKLLFILKK